MPGRGVRRRTAAAHAGEGRPGIHARPGAGVARRRTSAGERAGGAGERASRGGLGDVEAAGWG